jgi:hypothetical protein
MQQSDHSKLSSWLLSDESLQCIERISIDHYASITLLKLIQSQGCCLFNLNTDTEMTNSSFNRASLDTKSARCDSGRRHERVCRVSESRTLVF